MPYTKVMHKWKAGELHSGSKEGPVVKDQKQAVAIMLSEKREAEKGKEEYKPKGETVMKHNKGGEVKSSSAALHTQNLVETAANPTSKVGLKKGGLVAKANNPPQGGHWRRWGQGT